MDGPGKKPTGNTETTRAALISAGLHLFGEKGFAATSTRELAAAASANVASIAYHFGSKEGLRKAVAGFIVETMHGVISDAIGSTDLAATISAASGSGDQARRDAVAMALGEAIGRMSRFLLASPMGALIPRFVLREMAEPSEAFDILYSGVFEPAHKLLCQLFALATGADPESEDTRLTVFTLIAPLIYFRIGAPAIQRRMGWTDFGPDETRKAAAAATRTVVARLNDRSSNP